MSNASKSFEEIMFRDPLEVSPPAELETRFRFYVRSGDYTLMLTTPNGPIYAAYLFAGRAVEDGALHRLGDYIEVDECGKFDEGSILVRRETSKFLRRKRGIGERLLTALIAQEINNPWEF